MSMEDFFTLSEMKDGFSSTSRVEELMSSLLNQNNSAVSNAIDLARQWSAVAQVLVATEDKCCLARFLELDGLRYLNRWLRDATRFGSEDSDHALQELISLLLRVLQSLPVNMERLSEIGVCETVKEVLKTENTNTRVMARVLLDLWKPNGEDLAPSLGKGGRDKSSAEQDATSVHPVEVYQEHDSATKLSGGSIAMEHVQKDFPRLSTEAPPNVLEMDNIKDGGNFSECYSRSGHAEAHAVTSNVNPSISCNVSNSCHDDQLLAGGGSICPGAVASPISDSNASGSYSDCKHDSLGCKTFSEIPKESDIMINGDAYETTSNSPACSPAVGSSEKCKLSDTDMDGSDRTTISMPMPITDLVTNTNAGMMQMQLEKKSESHEDSSSEEEKKSESHEDSSSEESDSEYNEVAGLSHVDRKETESRDAVLSKQGGGPRTDTRSEVEFDFGDDALEFAVQVAMEATHEVADREQCSSSSKSSESRGDFNGEKEADPLLEDESSSSGNILDDESKVEQKEESQPSKGQELVEEFVDTTVKRECIFDLNEAACSEFADDMDIPCVNGPNNLSAPVAVVATSRGPPIFPGTPLHFEGELGWRGSAATSAFRPASPRGTPDKENSIPVPKEKQSLLGIDLNFAEEEDEMKNYDVMVEPVPTLPPLLSGDSSVQFSSIKEGKLKLDLNQVGDEDSPPSPSSSHQFSSASSGQHGSRNIDLNNNPSVFNASVLPLHGYANDPNNQTILESDEPAITLMGSRVTIEKKEPNNLVHPAWLHGSGVRPVVRPNSPRVMTHMGLGPAVHPSSPGFLTHTGLPSNGYSGPAIPPNQFLPSSFGLGPVPYVVDSRGTIVVPQLFAGSVESNGPYMSTLPFPGNLASSSHNSVSDGTGRPALSIDSGMFPLDGGSRELGSSSQFYFPGGRSVVTQDQIRASPPAFGSGMTLKRREPEDGWDCSPFGYKRMTSWQH